MDTHVLDWFLSADKRLDENVRFDIEAYPYRYCVSVLSLLEFHHLQQIGKKKTVIPMDIIVKRIKDEGFVILNFSATDIASWEDMPILIINKEKHTDQFDRALIAICKKLKMTMVSCDQKFPAYQKKLGLKLWHFKRN